jgi:hypothetical protein
MFPDRPLRLPAAFLAAALGAAAITAGAAAQPLAHTGVVELRQYRMTSGGRDGFVELFDRAFVDSQEPFGTRLVGQFRDLDDPDRFTWIRAWPGLPERFRGLDGFYSSDFWKERRNAANSFIEDSDNVLVLKPVSPGAGFAAAAVRRAAPGAEPTKAGLVVATIYYLWRDPSEGFAAAFETKLRPELAAAGAPVVAAFVRETTPNAYPRLPVREGEKVFVWFTRVDSPAAWDAAQKRLAANPGFAAELRRHLERPPEVHRLAPTPRSELR